MFDILYSKFCAATSGFRRAIPPVLKMEHEEYGERSALGPDLLFAREFRHRLLQYLN